MYTRCPKCKTVHPVTAKTLSHARGLVQCAQCGRAFSALSFLFDDWPSGEAHAPATGKDLAPPIIGIAKKTAGRNEDTEDAETGLTDINSHRLAWRLLAALLVLLTIANTAWTFREPLQQTPVINDWLMHNGWLQAEQQGLLKDPGQIQLVSRDMHSHPTRAGILVMSVTFVNLAQRPQIFPVLEITLLDVSNQSIAQRRFQPTDYLRANANTTSGLATDVFLPVLLELGDPGEQAVGFEIRFL